MAERENSVWGKIRVQLGDVQNYLLNGQYKEAVIMDKEILASLVRMQIDQALMVSSNLESDINQLFEGGIISAKSRDTYHGIRAFGELAELGNESTAQDANDSFSMLRDALSEYVEEGPGRNEGIQGDASLAATSSSVAYQEFGKSKGKSGKKNWEQGFPFGEVPPEREEPEREQIEQDVYKRA